MSPERHEGERGDAPAGLGLPASPSGEAPERDPLPATAATTVPAPVSRESVEDLARSLFAETGPPIDVWAIAALLESHGIRDRDAAERFGRNDVFALAHAVRTRMPEAGPAAEWVAPERPPRRKRVERFARIYGRGMFFFIPLTLQLISLLAVGVSQFAAINFSNAQASIVAVAATLAFVVTAGFIQSLGYLSPIYIESGKHMLAERVAWTVLGIGATGAFATGALLAAVAAVTGAYPGDQLQILIAYYALLAAQGLTSALLYMLRQFGALLLATVAGLVVTGVLDKRSSLPIEQVHWIGLAVAIGLQLLIGLVVMHRRAVNTKGDMRLARLPRGRLLMRRAWPFGVYGLIYFAFLSADRLVAWAAGSHLYPFWFHTPYELGLDWALGAILLSLAFLEVTVEDFSALLVPTAERFPINSVREFNRAISRFWARQLAYIGGLAAVGTWIAIVLAVGLHKLGALGAADKIYAEPVTHYVFGIGIAAYAFLSIGIANSVFLMSLNRPWRSIAAIGPGLAVSVLVGIALTSSLSYWTAVIGMLAGSVVFAAISAWQTWRTLRRADFFNYSAW
ncbi:MAG: hypothetical protein QOC54_1028 [Baekduia sp.]|nr:hypothetical protein [Baekduia sp.]